MSAFQLTIVSLDVFKARSAPDAEVHLSQHYARLGVEDAQVRVRLRHSVPESIYRQFGDAV